MEIQFVRDKFTVRSQGRFLFEGTMREVEDWLDYNENLERIGSAQIQERIGDPG